MALSYTSSIFQQVNTPALDMRRFLATLISSEGVVASADMLVAQRAAGANLSVDIAAGEALVEGNGITNQGFYYAYNDAVVNLAIGAAHATLPRIDRICLRVRDAFHGDAANDLAFVVVPGTATAGATLANLNGVTAVPAGHMLLANVKVAALATTIANADIDTTSLVRVPFAAAGSSSYEVAGASLASATTVVFTNGFHVVTGAVTIRNLDHAAEYVGQQVRLMCTGAPAPLIENQGGGTGNIRTASGYNRQALVNEIIVFTWDGTVWRETPGREPFQGFCAYQSAAQQLTGNVASKLAYNTEVYDPNGWYDPALYRFTPLRPGKYLITGKSFSFVPWVSGTNWDLIVYKNGAYHQQIGYQWNISGMGWFGGIGGVGIVEANGTSDYFEIWGVSTDTAATREIVSAGFGNLMYNRFQAAYLGAS